MGILQIVNQVMKRRMRDVQLKEKQKCDSNQDERRTKEEYPKMPADFECFVCGARFTTNKERKQHIKKSTHGDLYDTISPQEREEIRLSEDE